MPTFPTRFRLRSTLILFGTLVTTCSCAQQPSRGLPAEARDTIHTLFSGHDQIRREVSLTADGYSALTESDDPALAAALKKHVGQMQSRLASGLSVRRWDPAFAQYCDHYDQMEHVFTPTAKGVRMTVKGRTAKAAKIAQNHARIVSAFAAHGWSEHDTRHPVVP
jgi:hypothetical protein